MNTGQSLCQLTYIPAQYKLTLCERRKCPLSCSLHPALLHLPLCMSWGWVWAGEVRGPALPLVYFLKPQALPEPSSVMPTVTATPKASLGLAPARAQLCQAAPHRLPLPPCTQMSPLKRSVMATTIIYYPLTPAGPFHHRARGGFSDLVREHSPTVLPGHSCLVPLGPFPLVTPSSSFPS